MADTFATLMQGLPQPTIDAAQAWVVDTPDALANIDFSIANTTTALAFNTLMNTVFNSSRNCSILAIRARADEIAADFDITNPGGAPHSPVYGSHFPDLDDTTKVGEDAYDWTIDAHLGGTIYTAAPGLDQVVDDNVARLLLFADAREHQLYGTIGAIARANATLNYLSAKRASRTGTADEFDAVYP